MRYNKISSFIDWINYRSANPPIQGLDSNADRNKEQQDKDNLD